ncbi:MAG: hypothetical protein M3S32_11640 [Acidobacteriota bacterium]|nr:hypothetical protein [Acidobacteriota bacterium]
MNPGRMLAASSLIALMAFDASPASGCSLRSWTPAWTAIEEADWIVLARVERLEEDSPEGAPSRISHDSLERDVVVLEVLETWKGPRARELKVHFGSGGFRDRLSAGKTVVMFLERGESTLRRTDVDSEGPEDDFSETVQDGPSHADRLAGEAFERAWEAHRLGRIFPVGDASAILTPEESEARSVRDLIASALSLQESGPVDEIRRREWLVSASADRNLRAMTLFELEVLVGASGEEGALTASEAGAIAAGFTGAPAANESLPALLRLLSSYRDADLDRTVVSVIQAALAAPRVPYWLPEVIGQIVARAGWRDWGAAIWQRHLEDGTLRDLWPAVARDLHLSGIPAAKVTVEGGDFPGE